MTITVDQIMAGGILRPVVEVTSWYGTTPLGEIPVASGTATLDVGSDLLGRLEITVPGSPEWLPTHPRHPLAAYGQELIVRRGFALPSGGTTGWETLGTYRIASSVPDGGWVTVTADSIDVRLTAARWTVSTRTAGTFGAQVRQICAGIVPVAITMPDRAAVARTWEQQQPRRESLLELCDAWGAVLRMVDGRLTITPPPTGTTPAWTLTAERGLIGVAGEADTEMVPNVVVASSAPEDGGVPLSAMAVQDTGPRAWTSPYGQVPAFYASPLLTTRIQCLTAATTRLRRYGAQAPDVRLTAVTDTRIRPDHVVRAIIPDRDTDVTVRATHIRYAATPGQEPGEILGTAITGRIDGIPL